MRSKALLDSAISRQHTGIGSNLKYPTPIENAASLAFGLCMDHPFHNGNKRCALVSMLVHLDRNKLALYQCSQSDLYEVMRALAAGNLSLSAKDRERTDIARPKPDEEVKALAAWIAKRAGKLARGERQVTFRQLRPILKHHGYEFGDVGGNSVDVLKRYTETIFFVKREKWRRIGSIGYHDEGSVVPMKELKKLRKMCELREEDGVDSESFYDMAETVDVYVNRYRNVLRRLAKT